jgi:hypothetical protein
MRSIDAADGAPPLLVESFDILGLKRHEEKHQVWLFGFQVE